jgi:hypothetical protein
MKSKNNEMLPKYPDSNYDKHGRFRNTHQISDKSRDKNTGKNVEERKRLKVFTSLSSVPVSAK